MVRAAIEVLDEVGLDGLTMRLVAKHLGVQLNTVYWHASSKPSLLELMADALLVGCADDVLPEPWQDRLRILMSRYRSALLAHRDGARVVAGTYPAMENTLTLADAFLKTFIDAGFSDRTASWATWHSSYLVLGFVQEEQAQPEALREKVQRDVDEDRYPFVRRAMAHFAASDYEERFAFSVDVLIRGLLARKDGDATERTIAAAAHGGDGR